MNTTIEETQAKKVMVKPQKQGEQVIDDSALKTTNPLEELRKQAELAYDSYLGAQQKVTNAYKHREMEELETYKEVERLANKVYSDAIQKALTVRIESERSAREAYSKALEEIAKVYEQTITEALQVCNGKIEQKWHKTRELSEQIWNIFQGAISK